MFYERRATSTLQLYFLDVADYGSRLVMACGACGTLYATGDAAQAKPDMISKATKAAGELGSRIATGATRAVDRVSGGVRELLASGNGPPRGEPESFDDPLREDEEALEARFRELENRVRIDIGEK